MQENNFKVSPKSLKTAVTRVEENKIVTRGYNQRDLIEKIKFGDMVFLLLKGRLPSLKESKIFNHVLVSFCDHGVTPPSTQTARLITSSGSPMNSAAAGAFLSFGHKHAGAIEKAMNLYQSKINSVHLIDDSDIDNKQIASLAIEIHNEYILKDRKVPGFGHRYHNVDPRADKLIDLAINEGFIGPHFKLALALQDLVFEKKGIRLNVDGANAAILSDLGFEPELGLGIFMIGRLPGIIAHIHEEDMEEEEFRRFCDIDDVEYMDDKMEFNDVINERYSVRGYLDKEVEKEKLEYVLNAATIAPTGVNNQPFKVYVIDTKKHKDELSEIYGASWFVEAPYVLCVVGIKNQAWTRPWDQKNIADIDATIVMDHMILAATDVGLGTCYIAAFKKNKAHQFLNLDETEEAILFTPLGYGNAEPRDTPRKKLDEFVVYVD